ncbi:MAG: beta-ketoacyl-[acyl-carrier-protein] synthase family protein [Porticoccus sp.]|nr:beta-ketoacyl-[acyl-carrier-protein] synthase family protein [Porticoccus sp.]MBQ0806896.1 beta-ketoacyl-[acyl-carrier-protein] synthase family protein [Porticoccus sp.]
MPANKRIYLNAAGVVCSLGSGIEAVAKKLFESSRDESYLKQSMQFSTEKNLPVGEIGQPLSVVVIPEENTRNNRVLTTAIEPLLPDIEKLKQRYGARRIAVVVGTSTSGISDGEDALRYYREHGTFPRDYHYRKQEISSPSRYLARWLGLQGPAFSVSSACTSGAKALASGARLLRLGVCDAVIAGGVDTLCHMTIEGFSSLSITTNSTCNPFSVNRNGINIGEGAGIVLMTREPGAVRLAGFGETSDAHHISAPHPQGVGAERAMRQALAHAGMEARGIDYVNFHGTATVQNDQMEAQAVHRVFGSEVACGSTKALTGHTLAAAGAIEAIFCWLALQRDDGLLPVHRWDGQHDPELPMLNNLAATAYDRKLKAAMSNSFAFGGNNASLVLVSDE